MTENTYDNQGFTEEHNNNTIRKKRRRKTNLNEVENPISETVAENNDIPKREPRRRRRKEPRTSTEDIRNTQLGVAAYLEDLQDDIEVKVNTDEIPTVETLVSSKGKPVIYRGAGDKVYIEGQRTFRVEKHETYDKNIKKNFEKQSEKLNIYQNNYDNDLLQCSISVTERFRIFATFLHGLFAGMTIMHAIFSLIPLVTATSVQIFLTAYTERLQQPYSIFNYVAFIIVSISIWDRLDIAQPPRKCSPSQSGIFVAFILTLVAFVINNSLYLYQQNFNNYRINTSASYLQILAASYQTWAILDAVKSILLCVSWFIVAMVPVYDRFVEQLTDSMKQDINENY